MSAGGLQATGAPLTPRLWAERIAMGDARSVVVGEEPAQAAGNNSTSASVSTSICSRVTGPSRFRRLDSLRG